jgi:quercetin dioxygenase-like cupin family protein
MVASPGGVEQELGFEPPPGAPAPPPGAAPPGAPPGGEQQESRGSLKPYVLQPDEGEVTNVGGGRYVFKAKTEDTGGTFTLMEITFQRGSAPPPHIHHKEVEAFHLLDGEMTFGSGGQTLPAQSGSTVLLPIGLLHGYTIDTEESRALLVASPAGLEKFFTALEVAGDRPLSARQGAGFGVELVVPPGAGP